MTDWPEPPEKLRERNIWLCWRYEERFDKNDEPYQTKVPLNPRDGGEGDAADRDKGGWTDFDSAVRACGNYPEADGIGYAFPEGGLLVGVDLDDVRDPETDELLKWARRDVASLDSYTEVSPSGTGVHVVVFGIKPGDKCRKSVTRDGEVATDGACEVEIYSKDRFFTYTGDVLGEGFDEVRERNGELGDVYREYLGGSDSGGDDGGEWDGETPDLDLDDEEVLEKARNAENGEKFERLENGSDAGYNGDTSGADQAFVNYLAFYTGGDREQIDRLFQASGRMRDKWLPKNHSSYREQTIDTALSGRTEFYDPGGGSDGPDVSAAQEAQSDGDNDNDNDNDTGGGEDDSDNGLSLSERIGWEVLEPLDPPEDYEGETIGQKVAVNRAAEIFDDELTFVRPRTVTRGWRDSLYVYVDGDHIGRASDAGIFEPDAKAELERMGERLFSSVANDQFIREFVNKVERRNRVRARQLRPAEERLVVNNGILDLTTGELDAHTPDEYHRTKVEHDYDPDADCPAIDEFLHEVVEEKDVPTLYRFIAHALYRGYPEAKAAMLLGDGANGKSMFLSLVEEFLGEFNVSGRSLQDITEYRWAANDLVGKLANIHADMSDQDVDSMRMFKNLTGEDTVDADVKFEKPVKFTNHATMLFACNDMPVLKDDTQGNWRRWVLINFPNTFDDNDPSAKDAKARSTLENELFADDELEGLLTRCVEEIQAWQDGRAWFPDVPGWRDTRSKMRRAAEPVFDFAEACLVNADESSVEKSDVRDAYRQYATREGLPKMEREEFGRKLHMLADYNVEAGQQQAPDGPGRLQIYKGIELNARGEALIGGAGDDFDPREAVLQTVRGEDGRVPEALVIERLYEEYGIDNGRAEHAVKTLKKNGTLMLSKKHGVEWVEAT